MKLIPQFFLDDLQIGDEANSMTHGGDGDTSVTFNQRIWMKMKQDHDRLQLYLSSTRLKNAHTSAPVTVGVGKIP